MSVNRYEVTLEDTRSGNYYQVLVSTVDEDQAIKIAKKKAMDYHCRIPYWIQQISL